MDHITTAIKGVLGVAWSGITVAIINIDGLNVYVKFFTGLGGFVVVVFTAISFWYDILKKRKDYRDSKKPKV